MTEAGFFDYSSAEGHQTVENCRRNGWKVFELPDGIASKEDFFNGVRHVLPLDPPLAENQNWDALSDSLWSGLDGLAEEKILIVWPDAHQMDLAAPSDAKIASVILSELPPSLSDPKVTAGPTKKITVIRMV